jgi:hypothetical protein
MRPYGNEEMAWQRVLDAQREADNRRLLSAGGAPLAVSQARWIAGGVWDFAHALGLAPRWWARDAGAVTPPDASEPRPALRPAPRRRLAPRG